MAHNRISDPPPLFEHELIDGVPFINMRAFTACCPAQLQTIARQAQQAARELDERIRDARRAAEELDAQVEAEELDETARGA